MKELLFTLFLLSGIIVSGQIIYDPTTVYDKPGEFYHANQIYTIELIFYDANYHTTLKTWKENNIDNTLPAKFNYGAYHFDSVAVKYKGNSTFAVPNLFGNTKLPFNIDLNDIVGGQLVERYKKIKLSNVWFDPTFAREALASRIYKQYMPCYEANLIKVFVNGQYKGVYLNQEDVGKQFLKKHFGEKDGVFFKCEPLTEAEAGHPVDWPDLVWRGNDTLHYYESYERKSATGWDELLHFIDVLNHDITQIEQVLNVDRVLWNFAVSTVLSNEDTYNTTIIHNYYLYQTADGKFQMLPWDLSESFCGILFTGGTPQSHYELNPLYGLNPYFANRPLVYQLLSNNYYRKKYFAHIRTIIDEFYAPGPIKIWMQNLQAMAYTDIQNDNNKPFSLAQMAQNLDNPVNYLLIYSIAGITNLVYNRKIYLLGHPDVVKIAPEIHSVTQNIQHPSSSEIVYVSAHVTNAQEVKLRVTNNSEKYASDFLSVEMFDNGLNGDVIAGDNIYTAMVPFTTSNDHIKYYIEAENTEAMALMPERAEYFYYHYYVDQVVSNTSFINEEIEISVYPNPAFDYVTVSMTNTIFDAIKLYDLSGKVLYQKSDVTNTVQIDVSDYPAGTYLIEVIYGEKRVVKKLVVE